LTALPCHFYLETAQRSLPGYGWVKLWMVAGTVGALALGLLTTVLPMWLGLRAFRRLEV
jgi:hypothetical protein